MAKLYLALGSNIGARQANIQSALSFLNGYLGRYEALSDIISTDAFGFDGPAFLNCVARYSSRKSPKTILSICKEIEQRMGRTDQPQYAPDGSRIYHNRIVDIDILIYGNVRMETPELTIPHPQVESRPFIKPLLEQVMKNDYFCKIYIETRNDTGRTFQDSGSPLQRVRLHFPLQRDL